jgi:Arm domain-containing DNA-binding protein
VRQSGRAADRFSDGLARPNGAKSWHFRFCWEGKQPRISLDRHPQIGLKQARVRRDEARALVARAIDPHAHRTRTNSPGTGSARRSTRRCTSSDPTTIGSKVSFRTRTPTHTTMPCGSRKNQCCEASVDTSAPSAFASSAFARFVVLLTSRERLQAQIVSAFITVWRGELAGRMMRPR